MTGNNITERGKDAFLKLLVDVSSIKNTDNSNHTLTTLTIDDKLHSHLESALHINKTSKNSEAAGRAKVIKYQLNSQRRKKLCFMQGVEYSSIANLFVDVEPLLLPRILALIGRERGQSDFYTALIPMVPGLMSYIDRRALIDDAIAESSRYVAALEAECAKRILELTKKRNELLIRRTCMESRVDDQGKSVSDDVEQKVLSGGGKKRRF